MGSWQQHQAAVVGADVMQTHGDAGDDTEVGGGAVARPEEILLHVMAARDHLACE